MEPETELGPEQPETIQAAFERQVARSPHATAVVEAVDSSHRLSYSELRNASKELARCLLAAVHARRAGQQPSTAGSADAGNVVAVLVGSSVERMVSYYACLFAGCAFCPLEAGWPSKVCEKALALVQPGLLLVGSTDRACAAVACECCSRLDVPVLSLADDPKAGAAAHECGPNPTAHIIFTSGSSGDPKAVFCHHRGSLLSHASRIAAIERCEKSASAPASHDDTDRSATNKHVQQSAFGCGVFGVWDAVAAHFRGDIAVMLPDKALRDAEQLAALLAVNNVDRMLITPTLLDNLLSNAAACAGLGLLRSVTLCGELPSASLVARAVALLPPNTALVNLYSSCECHDVALGDLRASGAGQFTLEPLPHVTIHIVDEHGCPVPEGSAGSLLVGGNALAGGYLGADGDSGDDRLIETTTAGERVCRTGDKAYAVARTSADESIGSGCSSTDNVLLFTLIGREDTAVKVRGTLVDLVAVEAAFMQRYAAEAKGCVVVTVSGPPTDKDGMAARAASIDGTSSWTELGMAIVWNDESCCHQSQDQQESASAEMEVVRAATVPATAVVTEIRAALAELLPTVAVPLHIVELPTFPMDLLAGKCDRRAVQQAVAATVYQQSCRLNVETQGLGLVDLPPTGATDDPIRMVQRAMASVLQLPSDFSIQPEDNFFRVGGHSVAAVRLCASLGCRVADLIAHPTPARMARCLQLAKTGGCIAGPPTAILHRHVQQAQQLAKTEILSVLQCCPHERSSSRSNARNTILLTGVTGTLGSQLLRDFLVSADIGEDKRIVCLVRAADDQAALERTQSALQTVSGEMRLRTTAIAGDVAAPLLGLSPSAWLALADTVCTVVHAAAVVDRVAPLSALVGANVHATARLTQLAATAGATMHFVSSSAALPPVGTTAGNAATHWPALSGRWAAALEGSMHTQGIHGGLWEGYAQSKWICEQIMSQFASADSSECSPTLGFRDRRARGFVHRFGSLAHDDDMVAVLSASVVVGALPSKIQSVEWLDINILSAELVSCVAHELSADPSGLFSTSNSEYGSVRHYSSRCEAKTICQLVAQTSEVPELQSISTTEWRARIQETFLAAPEDTQLGHEEQQNPQSSGQEPREVSLARLRDRVKARVLTLVSLPSGLEGAIGLCERPLQSREQKSESARLLDGGAAGRAAAALAR